MADQLDATGHDGSFDPEAVADLAAHVWCRGEAQHLWQRVAVPEQATGEQRIEEANEVSNGGDERVRAGSTREGRIDVAHVEQLAVHLDVAVSIGRHRRAVPGGREYGPSEPERFDDAVGHLLP